MCVNVAGGGSVLGVQAQRDEDTAVFASPVSSVGGLQLSTIPVNELRALA